MPTTLHTTTPTAGDDFLIAFTGGQTLDGGDGDDYIRGDSFTPFGPGTSNSLLAPYDIDNFLAWTTMENPFVADSSIPHTTLYILADAGQTHYSSVTIGAGQTLTVDIDFGTSHVIGTNTDVFVEIYNSSGVLVGSVDDGSPTFLGGDEGSLSSFDTLLQFTNTGGTAEVFTIRFREFGADPNFEGGETFIANISVTGHNSSGAGGGGDTLNGGNGDDTIAGQAGNDSLFGDAGNDVLIGGSGNDSLDGGDGLDRAAYADADSAVTINLNAVGAQDTGGAGFDTLTAIEDVSGSRFNDQLTGNDGNNRLFGAGGNDILIGGLGDDLLHGGPGTDIANYTDAAGPVTVNLGLGGAQDTINAGLDTIQQVENIVGSAFADTLTGNSSDNVLIGGGGDDILNGQNGNDRLDGGAGQDTASYANATLGVFVDLGLTTAQDTGVTGVDTLVSIENVTGSEFNDMLIGSALGNVITALGGNDTILAGGEGDVVFGGGGNDSIDGGEGNDILFGDSGDDTVHGGAGDDVLFGTDGNDSVSGDAGSDIVFGEAGNDVVSGGADDDIVFGGAEADIVFGDAGDDLLFGDHGDDILRGGTGNDSLNGGVGNDVMDGGSGRDRADYQSAVAAITVNLSLSGFQNTGGADFDRLTSIEDLNGSAHADTLIGNSGGNIIRGLAGNDTIDGGANNDRLEGGAGDDAIEGGLGQDTASYESAESGVTVDLSVAGAQNTIGAGIDTLSGIERLSGSNHDDTLVGDGNANVLRGGLGADILTGALGNDQLFGDEGNDTLDGGDGDDYLNGSFDDDTLNGGDGNDRLYDTRGTNVMSGGAGDDEITSGGGNDSLFGNAGNDLIFGANGNDTINGGGGDDHLRGSNGDDSLIGSAGADRLVGGNHNDSLSGGDDNDLLFGDAGQDVLNGGAGNDNLYGGANGDTLTGGAGADRFRLDSTVGADTITDFSVPDDTIMIDGSVFTAFPTNGTLAASMFRAGTAAADANDFIIYNSANGRIFYDSDGSGAGGQVLIATVTPGTALTNADFVIYSVPSSAAPASMFETEAETAKFDRMEVRYAAGDDWLL